MLRRDRKNDYRKGAHVLIMALLKEHISQMHALSQLV